MILEDIPMEMPSGLVAYDRDQQPVLLDSLWTDCPVVLVFVRHFG